MILVTVEGFLTQISTPKSWPCVRDLTILTPSVTTETDIIQRIRFFGSLPESSLLDQKITFEVQQMTDSNPGHLIQRLDANGHTYMRLSRYSITHIDNYVGIPVTILPPRLSDDEPIGLLLDDVNGGPGIRVDFELSKHIYYTDMVRGLRKFLHRLVNIEVLKTDYSQDGELCSISIAHRLREVDTEFTYMRFVD